MDVASETSAEASAEPRSDVDSQAATDDAAAVQVEGAESADTGRKDEGGPQSVARTNDDNAEILEADEDIQAVYARPGTVGDTADGTEPEVVSVAEPERT